jgi:hypothetical protein
MAPGMVLPTKQSSIENLRAEAKPVKRRVKPDRKVGF